jgi:Tfp pilus assembly protein PilO
MMNHRATGLFSIIIAVGIFFGYVSPTWSGSIANLSSAIANDTQALAAAKAYTARQNELASAENAIDPTDLAKLTTFLPDSVDNVGLILDLDALAARSGLSLSNIDVATSPAASAAAAGQNGGSSPVGSVDLTLSAVGTYGALQQFLSGVERSARLLDITDLTVKGSDTGVYSYQMTVRLYWLR